MLCTYICKEVIIIYNMQSVHGNVTCDYMVVAGLYINMVHLDTSIWFTLDQHFCVLRGRSHDLIFLSQDVSCDLLIDLGCLSVNNQFSSFAFIG